jgi:hypothetical protein
LEEVSKSPTNCICEARASEFRPPVADELKVLKILFERKHSQRTGSVAKIAGGLELVQPIAEDY